MNAISVMPNVVAPPLPMAATWDVLTVEKLARREWSERFAARVQEMCDDPRSRIAMMVVDLPGLMEIAEIFGNGVKQALLQEAVVRLAERFGADSVSQLSAYRLAVVVTEVDAGDVGRLAQEIQGSVRQCRSAGGVMMVGVPVIGVALHATEPGVNRLLLSARQSAEDLIRRAELALGQAQQDNDGSVRIYTPGLKNRLRGATMLRQSLLRAIDQQEFSLAYQPVIDLQRDRTVGLEALIRWNAPGNICPGGPAEFIPAAEDSGLIVPIGTQVLNAAVRQASQWRRAGQQVPRIAINVSGLQLCEPDFLPTLTRCLAREGLTPAAIELELTERTLIESASDTIRLLEHLQGLGVVVSVDDFGTGYSSLRYLQDLPISKLKIDRSFVSRLESGGREQAMVQAIIGLATSFELKVVAEGIETQAQLDILRRQGCDAGQGYLFSRAVKPDEVVALFDKDWQTFPQTA